MPTGYTADIPKGISFEQYALSCARAFGALIMMRDDPADAPIPEAFEPSDYHSLKLIDLRARLTELEGMSEEAAAILAEQEYEEAEKYRLNRIEEIDAQERAYRAMLVQVNGWNCPTSDHQEFGKFMREQIEQTINFDCNGNEYLLTPTERLTGMQWLEKQIAKTIKDIAYHEKGHAEEVERTNQRNAWVKALRDSLVAK